MVRVALATALLVGCGGSAARDGPAPCKEDPMLIDKHWLAGDPDAAAGAPTVTAVVEVVGVRFEAQGLRVPAFSKEPASLPVRFEITEDRLRAGAVIDARLGTTGDDLAVFHVWSHQGDRCIRSNPYGMGCEEISDPCPQQEETPPWSDRRWARVAWDANVARGGERFFRSDAALAAGYPDAARYEPISHRERVEFDLDEGRFGVTVSWFLGWRKLDDGTPGCIFDFPDLEPGTPCPNVELDVRYEFRRDVAP
jgi:hypothetical protein